MRVPVKTRRRPAVGTSKPTYAVDLTWEEMREIKNALRTRLRNDVVTGTPNFRDTVSALAVVQWASEGRQ